MWCPSCQSSSPLVAIQPEGLICARCQVEVEFGQPAGEAAAVVEVQRPEFASAAKTSAELQVGIADDLAAGWSGWGQLGELPSLSLASVSASSDESGMVATTVPLRTASDGQQRVKQGGEGWQRSGRPREEALTGSPSSQSGQNSDSVRLTPLPANQPLYRFDQAHPPVGGRTKAAMELQRNRSSVSPRSGSANSGATARAAFKRTSLEQPETAPVNSAYAGPVPKERFSAQDTTLEAAPIVPSPLPGPAKGEVQTEVRISEQAGQPSEFAIRRVPRSFLLPRTVNRLPGRLCLLSGSLFLAGQSWLLWSFLKTEVLGVAGGILASAVAFALALYVISRYCDEDLERH